MQLNERSPQVKALDAVSAFGHPELAGETLNASRLDAAEGAELHALARRRRGDDVEAGPLGDDEERRYERLVGMAAEDEGLFARKRSETAEAEKLDALRRAERRHPQAEDLVAALLAEQDLFDGLRRKLRPETRVVDE